MKSAELLKDVDRPRFVPGGVADMQGRRLFVPGDQGGIVALVASSGEQLWINREVSLPLLGLNGALLAVAFNKAIAFHVLNAQTGERLMASSQTLALQAGAEWWATRVWREDDAIRVAWRTVHSRRVNGAPVIADVEGVAAIDLQAGVVSVAPVSATAESQTLYTDLTKDLTLFRAADGKSEAWRAGDYIAALIVDSTDGKERLLLVTWNTRNGNAIKRKELLATLPRSGYLEHHRSPDAENVFLLRCNDREEAGAAPGSLCTWLVFRVSDGKKLMTLPNQPGLMPPLAVIGNRLFYQEGGRMPGKRELPLRRLCAVDVASGAAVWSCGIAQQSTGQLL